MLMRFLSTVSKLGKYRNILLVLAILACLVCIFLMPNVFLLEITQPTQSLPITTLNVIEPTELSQTKQILTNALPASQLIAGLIPKRGYSGPFAAPICFSVWEGPP